MGFHRQRPLRFAPAAALSLTTARPAGATPRLGSLCALLVWFRGRNSCHSRVAGTGTPRECCVNAKCLLITLFFPSTPQFSSLMSCQFVCFQLVRGSSRMFVITQKCFACVRGSSCSHKKVTVIMEEVSVIKTLLSGEFYYVIFAHPTSSQVLGIPIPKSRRSWGFQSPNLVSQSRSQSRGDWNPQDEIGRRDWERKVGRIQTL